MNRKMKHFETHVVAVGALALMSIATVNASEYINATGGKWEVPTNWDTGLVPGGSDTITIAGSTDQQVVMDTNSWAYLTNSNLLNNATRYRTATVLLGGTGSTTLMVDIGAGNQWQATSGGGYYIGNASGSDGMLSVISGDVNFEASLMTLGALEGSTGAIRVTGADASYTAGRASDTTSLSVGPAGQGSLYISDGTFQSRMGVSVGTNGTFEVAGSAIDEVGVGSYSSLNGNWQQDSNGVLKVGIDAGGLTPILIDDKDFDGPDGFSVATFEDGALLEPYFIDGSQTGKWTVMTVDGSITDLGLTLDNGGDTNWSFNVVSNYILEAWYGLGDSGYTPPEPPAIVYTNVLCVWDGEAADNAWDNPTNWAFASNMVLPDTGATLQLDTVANYAKYTPDLGSRGYARIHVGYDADGRFDITGSGYTLGSTGTGGQSSIGANGNTGTLNMDGGATINYGAALVYVGNAGSTGIVNVVNGSRMIFGRENNGVSGRIGFSGGYGEVNIVDNGRFLTRAGVVLGLSGGIGLFSVEGAGGQVGIGSEGSVDGSWTQYAGSTLRSRVSDSGITTIQVVDKDGDGTGGDVTFNSGTLLDVGFTGFDGENGSWDVMTWEGTLTDSGLGFSSSVDESIWSYAFVDTDSSNGVDTLRITAAGLITEPTVQPDITDISAAGTTISLTWDSEDIVGYNVLSAPNLVLGPWTTNIAGITGMGASTSTNLTGGGTEEFYMIEAFGQ